MGVVAGLKKGKEKGCVNPKTLVCWKVRSTPGGSEKMSFHTGRFFDAGVTNFHMTPNGERHKKVQSVPGFVRTF